MINYRADVDGLRAIAILAVVLFHAGVSGFSGGFVGVDVFFVISGYLITTIIRDEMRRGSFKLRGFYERRARRILPAFFAMLLGCFLLAAVLLYPPQFLPFAKSAVAASLFISAFWFRGQDGYFDPESKTQPLLHTWSLSVEEIFYLVFPLLLLALRERSRRTSIRVLIGIAVVSLLVSVVALAQDPRSRAAFFLPSSRAWELLLGALLAYGVLPPAGRPAREAAGLAGVALIGFAVFGFSQATTFPGINAAVPCVGAALVIWAGCSGRSAVSRLLASPALVRIGLISYPLYLWHWPLLVFARERFGDSLPGWGVAAVLALSFGLAALSTRFVERPFRRRDGPFSRRQVFALSAAGIAAAVAFAEFGVRTDGWTGRYSPEVVRVLRAQYDRDARWKECLHTRPDAEGCLFGAPDRPPSVALWGDSHAAVYSAMLGELGAAYGQSVLALTMPACPPADHWAFPHQRWRENCLDFQALALRRLLESPSIRTVVLGARFVAYPIDDAGSGLEQAFRSAIRRLGQAGKRVYVLYPVPENDAPVPVEVGRAIAADGGVDAFSRPAEEFRGRFQRVFEFLDRIVAEESAAGVEPHRQLCDDARCYFYREGVVLYLDDHHLSLSGARAVKQSFRTLFEAD